MSFFREKILYPLLGVKSIDMASVGMAKPQKRPDTSSGALADAYDTNELVYACVSIKASASTDPRLIVEIKDSEGNWQEEPGHPFRRLFMQPNEDMDETAFMKAAVTSNQVAGAFYAEIVRSGAGGPVELRPLDPTKITPKYRKLADGSRELDHYEWKDGTYTSEIDPEDMLVRSDWHIGKQRSPLARAMGNVNIDTLQTDFVRGFFEAGAVPSGILKIHGRTVQQKESDRLRLQWRAKYSRAQGNVHDVAVLDQNADYERIGAQLNELESELLRAVSETRICQVFGVPPLIVYAYIGLMRATYSNLDEAWAQFWKTTMSALLKEWRIFFTLNLLSEFVPVDDVLDEKIRLRWDTTNVSALQEDVDAVHSRVRDDFTAGLLTLNEARAALGAGAWPDDDLGETNPHLLSLIARAQSPDLLALIADELDKAKAVDERSLAQGVVREIHALRGARPFGLLGNPNTETPRATAEFPSLTPGIDWQLVEKQRAEREEEREELEDYELSVFLLAQEAAAGEVDRDDFVEDLQGMAFESYVAFYLLGMLEDSDGVLTEDEWDEIGEQAGYAFTAAEAWGDDIVDGRSGGAYDDDADGVANDKLNNRASLWGGAAAGLLVLGRRRRRDDPLFVWVRGATEEPCSDCVSLNGVQMRASQWRLMPFYPRASNLECQGYNCQCDFYEVEETE